MVHQRVPKLRASEVIRILRRNNFGLVSQRGSYQRWHNHETGQQVIVPSHQGK
jgi:predicted RNA binding protein YcfA (HicA-like mRNA interferase family)